MHPVEVTGSRGRVRLREFDAADVPALHAVYGDPVATRYLSFEPRTSEEVELIVKRILADARAVPRREYAMAVELTHAGGRVEALPMTAEAAVIGMARLAVGEYRSGQIGFALRPDCWGQGLGTEAVQALLLLGFEVENVVGVLL